MPAMGSSGPAPAAPPPPAAPAPSAPGATAPLVLRIGSSGPLVRRMQRALRGRGFRVAVDGAFGPATRRAVRRFQGRLGVRRTGIANASLLRRLGVRTPAPPRAAKAAALAVFPVQGAHSYGDDWGAPRPQGGHEGTDILADRATPVVAADAGRIVKIARTETGRGGIYLWLRRSDGIQYYYAHMESIVDGIDLGAVVGAGQIVGGVGNSGDARGGPTHLHFEVRREWTPFDPYPELVAVDADEVAAPPAS